MPVHVEKHGSKFRVVEKDGKIASTANGNAKDGGGHNSKAAALAQVRAINRSK